MKALLKYIANEPMAAIGFAGIYVFGSIEVAIRLWSTDHPNLAAFFLSSMIVFTKCNLKKVVIAIRLAKKKPPPK